jgi:hypothetical protein
MSILDSLLTPQNVERGVNFLQSNKGIVDALAHNLTFLPSSGRLYAKNLAGSTTPINEDFFSANQLAEIKRRTAEEMANKSMQYDWASTNTMNQVVPYNLESPLSLKSTFTNPKVDIDMSLGTSVYKQNPDGTISVIDKHDFDSFAGGTHKGFYSEKGDPMGGKDYEWDDRLVGPPDEREEWWLDPKQDYRDPKNYTEGETINHWIPHMGWDIEYGVPKYEVAESDEKYIARAIEAYKNNEISKSKLARIVGGTYGHTGMDPNWEYYKSQGIPIKTQSAIPININLGKISHLDKLKANKAFARYIAETETIPSKIRKEAQKIVPKRTAPIHSPHGGGPGTGGGDYRASRPASERQFTGHGKSGMGRDPRDRMAHGGLIDIPLPGRSRYI